MPVTPEVRRLLDAIAKLDLPARSMQSVAEARAGSQQQAQALPPGPEASVVERWLPGSLPVRIYRPTGSEGKQLPALVYFHGGGFVVGSLQQADADCRRLATAVPCVVVSVDYPLAPECRFPDMAPQCHRALCWVHDHAAELEIDATCLAVGGDSAGGNLATVVSMLARDAGGPALLHQLLIYPVTDISRFDTASYVAHAEGYFLTRADMKWYVGHYLRDPGDAQHPHASPLLATDLRGLPPALVITAQYDPLLDEGEAYARRLQQAGVPTTLTRYSGMIHGFFTMSAYLPEGERATQEAIVALRAAFAAAES